MNHLTHKLMVNSRCKCGINLNQQIDLISFIPCYHILHLSCAEQLSTECRCPICQAKITATYSLATLRQLAKTNPTYAQMYIDMLSVTRPTHPTSYLDLIPHTSQFLSLLYKLHTATTMQDGVDMCKYVLKSFNIKLELHDTDKISKTPVVFISKHTNPIDTVINASILQCGFLASTMLKTMIPGIDVTKFYPVVIVQRGKSNNVVNKLKQYVNTQSICVYPEGLHTHPRTICKFRTGAFRTGHPIQPIVINYPTSVYAETISDFFAKCTAQSNPVIIRVQVLDVESGNFTDTRIEQIRQKMAIAGRYALSRVSNRDICDY